MEADILLIQSLAASSRALYISLNNLQLKFVIFKDIFVKATIYLLYDVNLYDRVENKDEIFDDYFTCCIRLRREIDKDEKHCSYFSLKLLTNSIQKIKQHQF